MPLPEGPAGRSARLEPGTVVVSLIVLSAFGPYVLGGVRTEQLVVYGSGALIGVIALPAIAAVRLSRSVLVVIGAWTTYVVVAALAPPVTATTGVLAFAAGLDNVLLPMAIVIICVSLVALGCRPDRLVWAASAVVPVMMIVNAAAAVLQYRGVATWGRWWSADVVSTAVFAATNGRYSGLIAQPAEAGALYGIAMLCAFHRWRHRPAWLVVALAVLAVGGMLSVSKVFLLVALPILMVQLFLTPGRRRVRWVLLAGLLGLLWIAIHQGRLSAWAGLGQLTELLPGAGGSWLWSLTAGRFGAGSTLSPVVQAVLTRSPVLGFGAAGLPVPYDNGWVEALVVAGVIGFVCYTIVLVVFCARGLRSGQPLFWGVALLALGASFGIPALTANRVGVICWLLLMLLLLHATSSPSWQSRPSLRIGARTVDQAQVDPTTAGGVIAPHPPSSTRSSGSVIDRVTVD